MAIDVELQVVRNGYDRKTCWVHTRPGFIPGGFIPGEPSVAVITMQKLRLTGNDVFYALSELRSDDGGQTWQGPVEHAASLGRRPLEDGAQEGLCDFWPLWHEKTGVLLGTGHTVRYGSDDNLLFPFQRYTGYSVYRPETRSWTPWRRMEMPDTPQFFMGGAGSTQRVDLPNGDILLPAYFTLVETVQGLQEAQDLSTVVRCRFDGETLTYLEHGDEFTVTTGRGFSEPSLAFFDGRYFLTLRNDDFGAVAVGTDGLHFSEPRLWTFDDGSDLGNYNTQQHWITMPDALYLVYTRRGANNDHVFRHRAPLFIAQVDPDRLCVLRKTEQVLVPERGARLCNFGVVKISETESWVTVAEWMQTTLPDPYDFTVCERYGSDNSIYLARVRSRAVS